MKISLIFYTIGAIFLFSIKDGGVSAQSFMPGYYGGGPISISDDRNDDDLGFLLAILLLACRRGCGGGCGGGSGGARVVPVPYPIPFPMSPGNGRGRHSRKVHHKDMDHLNPILVYDSLEGDSNGPKNDGKSDSNTPPPEDTSIVIN